MTPTTSSSDKGTRGRFASFVDLIKTWLLNFEVNSQIFVEMMNDKELPVSVRALAIGILIYVISPIDIIPEKVKVFRVLSLIDDVAVMITGLSIIVSLMPESRLEHYKAKYQAVAQISEYVDILKAILGILWDRLMQFVEKLRSRHYKKQTAEDVAQSAETCEDLFDEVMVFVADLNLNPEMLDKELAALPAPEKIIGLLASGIQEDEEHQAKAAGTSKARTGFKRLLPSGKENQET